MVIIKIGILINILILKNINLEGKYPFKEVTNSTCLQKILHLVCHGHVMKQHTTLLRSLPYL